MITPRRGRRGEAPQALADRCGQTRCELTLRDDAVDLHRVLVEQRVVGRDRLDQWQRLVRAQLPVQLDQ
jgi:hypothetical protein